MAPGFRRGRLGLHRSTTISMQGHLAGWDVMFAHGLVDQRFEQAGGFRVGDMLADDPAAEDVEDDIEIKIAPFRRTH